MLARDVARSHNTSHKQYLMRLVKEAFYLRCHNLDLLFCLISIATNGVSIWGYDNDGTSACYVTWDYMNSIVFLNLPIPPISTSTTSPFLRNVGGLMNNPTPPGVPVIINDPF